MKTIGVTQSLPVQNDTSLVEFETEKPKPNSRDLLLKVQAVSVNPVDVKARIGAVTDTILKDHRLDNITIIKTMFFH